MPQDVSKTANAREAVALKATGGFSRREVMAGAAALGGIAALAGLPSGMAYAQPATSIELGSARLHAISDGNLVLGPASGMAPDVPKAELEALLSSNGFPLDETKPPCNIAVLEAGDRLIVFDAGSGPNFQPSAGKLAANLEAAGIDREAVTHLVLTHAHPDHLWGALDDFDEPLFSNAAHLICATEWDYWQAGDTLEKTPEARKSFVVGAQSRLNAIEDRLERFMPGSEILPGVMAVDSAGHTPGHVSFELDFGGERLFLIGDAIAHPILAFQQPRWRSGNDQDGDKAIETRVRLLDKLASEKLRLLGFHLPFPGFGMAEAKDGAYRFVAI